METPVKLTYVAVCFIHLSATAFAQSDRGVITGTVSDPTGAMVPAASVIATHAATGAIYKTVTTNTGNYTLPSLPVGTYDLTVESPGFTKYIREGITVQTVQEARLDISLRVGSASESLTVNAERRFCGQKARSRAKRSPETK